METSQIRPDVRHGSHRSESPQNGLRDEQTCETTLTSAYVLCHLSAADMVATSDDGKKSKMGVSADWCVTIEHWRSSSIKDYLCQLSN